MSVKSILVEEFESELKEVKKLEVGSDKHKNAVDSLTKLADRIIEIEKLKDEADFKRESLDNETSLKEQQFKDEKKDRNIKNGLTAVNVIGGLGFAAWAFVSSMNFEKEGTLTTDGGKSALRHLLKFKW